MSSESESAPRAVATERRPDGASELHCFVDASPSRRHAREGALSGLRFAVKDLFALEGHVSTFGLSAWRASHPPSARTAPLVDQLLGAGADLVGLTKMDQLAFSLVGNSAPGPAPINTRFPTRFTGGSSSGSASAVAGGVADFALATDTAGSIRLPAAACGLVGWRPTWGLLDATDVLPLAPTFDVPGVLASSLDVLERVANVLVGDDQSAGPAVERVLVADGALGGGDAAQVHAWRDLLEETLPALEVEVTSLGASKLFSAESAALFVRVETREIWATHGAWVSENWGAFDPEIRERLENAERLSKANAEEQAVDRRRRDHYRARARALLGSGRVLLAPVTLDLPPSRAATSAELRSFRERSFRLATFASLSGLPQLVVPLEADDVTYGLGLIGAPRSDRRLLGFARRLTA